MSVEIILFVVGLIVGGLINWFFAHRSGAELRGEALELRRLNTLMLLGMEQAGWIKVNRDHSGKILGFNQTIQPTGIESSEAFGYTKLEVKPPVQVVKPTGIESGERFGVPT